MSGFSDQLEEIKSLISSAATKANKSFAYSSYTSSSNPPTATVQFKCLHGAAGASSFRPSPMFGTMTK
ncbi:hypothetical protein EV1_001592 [Malus domestica]